MDKEFLNKYCDFSNPNWVWILTAMSRNKDQTSPNAHKYMSRFVLTSSTDIDDAMDTAARIANHPETYYRMYISLNARDVVKGFYQFHKKMADIGYGVAMGRDDALAQSKKIGSIWKTELAQTSCRATKRFLLDVDNSDKIKAGHILNYMEDNGFNVRVYRPTVSGVAIVFDACDTRDLLQFCKNNDFDVDLQRDSMVFVSQWLGGFVYDG